MDIDLIHQNLAGANLTKVENKASVIKEDQVKDRVKNQELKEACAGFEAIFLNTMMKAMRQSLPGDQLFPKSNGMDIYQSLYDQYLTDELSQSETTIGVKEFLYEQLKKS